jgi:hypothetical protein
MNTVYRKRVYYDQTQQRPIKPGNPKKHKHIYMDIGLCNLDSYGVVWGLWGVSRWGSLGDDVWSIYTELTLKKI